MEINLAIVLILSALLFDYDVFDGGNLGLLWLSIPAQLNLDIFNSTVQNRSNKILDYYL
jgi:hypothetical protein